MGTDSRSCRRRIQQVTPSQRSSLRCAIRESLKSLDEADHKLSPPGDQTVPSVSPIIDSNLLDPAQAELNKSTRRPGGQLRDIQGRPRVDSGVARPFKSKTSSVSILYAKPQRSSLRRAIRESLESVLEPIYRDSTSQEKYPNSEPTNPLALNAIIDRGPRNTTRNKVTDGNDGKSAYGLLQEASKPKPGTTLATGARRMSLRQATRESLRMASASSTYTNIEPKEIASHRDDIPENATTDSHLGVGGVSKSEISLLDSSTTHSDALITLPNRVGGMNELTRFSHAHSISPIALSPASFTAQKPEPATNFIPQKSSALKMVSTTEPIASLSLPSRSKSSSYLAPSDTLRQLGPPTDAAQHPNPILPDRSKSGVKNEPLPPSRLDSQPTSTHRGWHRVREIINDTPSGLYLVEWEGYDPRTGVKWPASWVKAKDVSPAVIHEWEQKKHQILYIDTQSL